MFLCMFNYSTHWNYTLSTYDANAADLYSHQTTSCKSKNIFFNLKGNIMLHTHNCKRYSPIFPIYNLCINFPDDSHWLNVRIIVAACPEFTRVTRVMWGLCTQTGSMLLMSIRLTIAHLFCNCGKYLQPSQGQSPLCRNAKVATWCDES